MNIDVKGILQNRLASSLGLDKYQYIMEHVMKTDVSADEDFQRIFNGFYIVRRNEEWRNVYYSYFEKVKNRKPTFEDIIIYLYEKTGNVEPSFSSKMLATIIPEKPIWDRYVVQNLNIKLSGLSQEEKLKSAIEKYSEMERWYEDFLNSEDGHNCVEEFERFLPDYKWISNIKKVDALLWSAR